MADLPFNPSACSVDVQVAEGLGFVITSTATSITRVHIHAALNIPGDKRQPTQPLPCLGLCCMMLQISRALSTRCCTAAIIAVNKLQRLVCDQQLPLSNRCCPPSMFIVNAAAVLCCCHRWRAVTAAATAATAAV
jgi:hypothetical protein